MNQISIATSETNRLDFNGWHFCPEHQQMEFWSYGSCICMVDAYLWNAYVNMVSNKVLKLSVMYPLVYHGPDPITIR